VGDDTQPPWTFSYQHPFIRQEREAPGVLQAMRDHLHPNHATLGADVSGGLSGRDRLCQACTESEADPNFVQRDIVELGRT
jgi:hypothetical protein